MRLWTPTGISRRTASGDIDKAVDTTIYEDALEEMMEREPEEQMWQDLMEAFEENNG